MKILLSFLCLLIAAATPAAAQEDRIVPIAAHYYLLGGTRDGRWLKAEAVAPVTAKDTEMLFVDFKGVVKRGAVLINTGEEYGACPENKLMRLEPHVELSFAVGANAGWNLVPRAPRSIGVANKNYRKIAAEFLRTKGIVRTPIRLSQIVEVDLEGDGSNEVLITGNFYKRGNMEPQTVGDYSFALLRKNVGGKPRNILIEGEFFTARGYYDPPNRRNLLAVADLNGDGRMEFVLDTSYYEGSWKQVFEINDAAKLVRVLEASCLV